MLFEDDVTMTFTMNAFNKGGRFIHIMGTRGEVHAAIDGQTPITIYDFLTDNYNGFSVSGVTTSVDNHLIVFAAEESRVTNKVINLEEFAETLKNR